MATHQQIEVALQDLQMRMKTTKAILRNPMVYDNEQIKEAFRQFASARDSLCNLLRGPTEEEDAHL